MEKKSLLINIYRNNLFFFVSIDFTDIINFGITEDLTYENKPGNVR